MYRLRPANSSIFDHAGAFADNGFIDWSQRNYRYELGDIIYIYCTSPVKRIQYRCVVEKKDMTFNEKMDDKKYWHKIEEYEKRKGGKFVRFRLKDYINSEGLSLENLRKHGLAGTPEGARNLNGELLEYINAQFEINESQDDFLETVEDENPHEGFKTQVMVNKYERSSLARDKCIKHNGTRCKICNMSFYEEYGELGKDFIHVHHIIPIHTRKEGYSIDFEKDLIPVCPNCHAMLHRRINGEYLTVEELKSLVISNRISKKLT